MDKQALRMAIAECYGLVENGLGVNMTAQARERIACGAFGLHIIDLLLSEPEAAEEIQGESGQQKPKQACPRCGNDEFEFNCRNCGLPIRCEELSRG